MFRLEIKTSNAAFTENDHPGHEIAYVLRGLADHLAAFSPTSRVSHPIRDSNDNTVGTWQYTSDDE